MRPVQATLKRQGGLSLFTSRSCGLRWPKPCSRRVASRRLSRRWRSRLIWRVRGARIWRRRRGRSRAGLGHTTSLRGLMITIPKVTSATDALNVKLAALKAAARASAAAQLATAGGCRRGVGSFGDGRAEGAQPILAAGRGASERSADSPSGGLRADPRFPSWVSTRHGARRRSRGDGRALEMGRQADRERSSEGSKDALDALEGERSVCKRSFTTSTRVTGASSPQSNCCWRSSLAQRFSGWAKALKVMAGAEVIGAVAGSVQAAQAAMVTWEAVGGGALARGRRWKPSRHDLNGFGSLRAALLSVSAACLIIAAIAAAAAARSGAHRQLPPRTKISASLKVKEARPETSEQNGKYYSCHSRRARDEQWQSGRDATDHEGEPSASRQLTPVWTGGIHDTTGGSA